MRLSLARVRVRGIPPRPARNGASGMLRLWVNEAGACAPWVEYDDAEGSRDTFTLRPWSRYAASPTRLMSLVRCFAPAYTGRATTSEASRCFPSATERGPLPRSDLFQLGPAAASASPVAQMNPPILGQDCQTIRCGSPPPHVECDPHHCAHPLHAVSQRPQPFTLAGGVPAGCAVRGAPWRREAILARRKALQIRAGVSKRENYRKPRGGQRRNRGRNTSAAPWFTVE